MPTAPRLLSRPAEGIPVPRWVRRVFLVMSISGVTLLIAVSWFLYREVDHGHLSVDTAGAFLAAAFLVLVGAGIAVFMKVALPPVYEQTRQLERTLEQQLEVNRRQRDFLVHVHHELRTPVTIVLGATQLLAAHGDGLAREQRLQLREMAARNAEALSTLVDDLTAGVDEALPGLAFHGDVDNWSSTRSPR